MASGVNDLIEHNYSLCSIVDCLKYYYVAGYLSYQLTKRINCVKCQASFTVSNNTNPDAILTNIKSKGQLKYPNNFYNLIRAVESELNKPLYNIDVFVEVFYGFVKSLNHLYTPVKNTTIHLLFYYFFTYFPIFILFIIFSLLF